MDMSLSKCQEVGRTGQPGVLQSVGSERPGMTEQLNHHNNKY